MNEIPWLSNAVRDHKHTSLQIRTWLQPASFSPRTSTSWGSRWENWGPSKWHALPEAGWLEGGWGVVYTALQGMGISKRTHVAILFNEGVYCFLLSFQGSQQLEVIIARRKTTGNTTSPTVSFHFGVTHLLAFSFLSLLQLQEWFAV